MEKGARNSMVSQGNMIVEPTPLRYYSISNTKAFANGLRIDASIYQALGAIRTIKSNPYGWVYLWSDEGLIDNAYYPGRYKRIYTDEVNGVPFFLPSQLEELDPKPSKFVAKETAKKLSLDRIKSGTLLLSRSGTIGRCSIASKATIEKLFSDDVIRITFQKPYYLGYVYAFFKTETGLKALQANNYGAVIDHIEPEHLSNVPIPNPPEEVKKAIHDLVVRSYELRDESNDLIDEAQNLLYEALGLPRDIKIDPKYYARKVGFRNFCVNSSRLNARLDASYHLPEVDEVLRLISKNAQEITTLGDPRLTKNITLPDRFKRVYVEKEYGVPLIGGRELLQLTPSGDKYLLLSSYSKKMAKSMMINANDVLVSARGSIGRCAIVPKHWDGFAISDNIIKVVPSDNSEGYIYAFLFSDIGALLINRMISGSVVDVIEPSDLIKLPIPILNSQTQISINNIVLMANELRYQAYLKEQEALDLMNEIIYK